MKRIITTAFSLLNASILAVQAQAITPQLAPYVEIQQTEYAITNATLIDGTGAPAREGQTVLVRDGNIVAVGPTGSVSVSSQTFTIDGTGKTVIPGFVMVHEHLFYPAGQRSYNQLEYSFPRLYLAGGATTIRTGGSRDPYGDLNLKAQIESGTTPGPNIHVTAPYLNGPGLPINFVHALDGPEEARRMVNYWADLGATSFKAYMHISRAELGAAVEEAHRRGLTVTGHLCSVTYREAADLGIDNLEHGLYASTDFVTDKQADVCPGGARRALTTLDPHGPEASELIQHLVENGVALTSTLTVFETSVAGRPVAPRGALDAMSPQARDQYLRRWAQVQGSGGGQQMFETGMAFEKAFADAGGLLVAGTDPTGYGGVVAGYANQREVELLVEAGFTAEQAIQVATMNGAILLGVEDRTGTLVAGKAADLILIDGNPARRIADIRQVEIVFRDGIGYNPAALIDAAAGLVGIRD
jgi:imidazolonepropionase-like amidohydrolase